MKSIIAKLIIASILLIFAAQPALYASDLSIGATTWYTAWKYKTDGLQKVEYEPDFLYGPVMSLAFTNDFNISFIFLYGQFTMNPEGSNNSIKLDRYDSDLALNYRMNNYFKIFAGAKYLAFTWPNGGKHQAIGPGAGISSVLPLGGNFFILGYISAMYLRGHENGDTSSNYKTKANELGGNASISLAYYIPSASTTISLGGRYQQINIYYDPKISPSAENSISKFYGVTLSAIYTFNI